MAPTAGGDEEELASRWASIPEPVVGMILGKVSFRSLQVLARVCKSWRDLIAGSLRPRLALYHRESLVVYEPGCGSCVWEVVPLRCPAALLDRFGPLHLLASAAGPLLCFLTSNFEKFIVCNALTGTCTEVDIPYGGRSSADACMPEIMRIWPKSCAFVVGLAVDGSAGGFRLTVACAFSDPRLALCDDAGRVIVYDSSSREWTRIRDVPPGRPIHISYTGDVYLVSFPQGPALHKYDAQEKVWRVITLPSECISPWKLLEFDGKTSLMVRDPKETRSLAIFELRDSEAQPWPVARTLPVIRMFEALQRDCDVLDSIEGFSCLGFGKYMFFTGVKESYSGLSWRRSLRTGVHDFSSNSSVLSEWSKFSWLLGCPSPVCQILQPNA